MKKQIGDAEDKIEPKTPLTQLQSLNLKADHLDIRRKKLEKELESFLKKEDAEKV